MSKKSQWVKKAKLLNNMKFKTLY